MGRKKKQQTTEEVDVTITTCPPQEDTITVNTNPEYPIVDEVEPQDDNDGYIGDEPVENDGPTVQDPEPIKEPEEVKKSPRGAKIVRTGEYLDCHVSLLENHIFERDKREVEIYDVYRNEKRVILKDRNGHILSDTNEGLSVVLARLVRDYRASKGSPRDVVYSVEIRRY